MKSSCASDLPSLLTRRSGYLPELLDEDARPGLVEALVYDSFGRLVPQPDLPARFAFAALEVDPCEGLHAAAARCSNPTAGRWEERDPIGFAAGDANLYRYANADPRGICTENDGTIRDA